MVYADDAVYDGLVDGLLRHPRAAQPEGSPSAGHGPHTCRRDKGDETSAAAPSPSGRWTLPPAEPSGLRRPRGGLSGGQGAEPSPYPARSGGAGAATASTAQPRPRLPPSRCAHVITARRSPAIAPFPLAPRRRRTRQRSCQSKPACWLPWERGAGTAAGALRAGGGGARPAPHGHSERAPTGGIVTRK